MVRWRMGDWASTKHTENHSSKPVKRAQQANMLHSVGLQGRILAVNIPKLGTLKPVASQYK